MPLRRDVLITFVIRHPCPYNYHNIFCGFQHIRIKVGKLALELRAYSLKFESVVIGTVMWYATRVLDNQCSLEHFWGSHDIQHIGT